MTDDREERESDSSMDRRLGDVWTKVLSLLPFGVAVALVRSAYDNRDEFETYVDYLATGVFILAFVAIGVWLWRRKKRLSDELDQ